MNVETVIPEARVIRASNTSVQAWFRRHRWFALIVVLPTALSALYYGLIASDIYVSQSRFVIKAPGQKSVPGGTLANLIQTSGFGGGEQETKEVLDFIRSRAALSALEKKVRFRARYEHVGIDRLSRFPQLFRDDSFENLYQYYSGKITADMDPETGTAVLEVRAFAPEDAYVLNERLLEFSEALVNKLNERAEKRAVTEGERRVASALDRARRARVAMSNFRNSQQIVDPAKQATGVLEISNELITEQASLEAQLRMYQRATPRHPAIAMLRSRLASVSAEIASQNARAVGSPTGIASKLGNYEGFLTEQEFATQNLTAASASLEMARVESQKQQFYLERVVNPNKPDMPVLPKRLIRVLTIAAMLLCIYFIAWMFVVGILEHSPED